MGAREFKQPSWDSEENIITYSDRMNLILISFGSIWGVKKQMFSIVF